MTQQLINLGAAPDTQTGDTVRQAFVKINDNFSELYQVFGANGETNLVGDTIIGNNINVTSNIRAGNIFTYGNLETTGNVLAAAYFYPNGASVFSNVVANLQYVNSDILPVFDNVFSIGSSDLQFLDAYLGNSIVLQGSTITTANGAIYVDGNIVTGSYSNANVAAYLPVYSGNVNAAYYFGNGSQLSGIDATSIQNGTSNVRVYSNSDVIVTANTDYQWTFGTDGVLTLPDANLVDYPAGVISFNFEGNNFNQLRNHNSTVFLESVEDAPPGYEVYGKGAILTQLAVNDSDVIIHTNMQGNIELGNTWTFGADGNLTFPNGDLTIGHDPYGDPAIIGAAGKNIAMIASGVGDGYEIGSSLIWVDSITEPTKIAGVTANNPLYVGAGDVGIVTGDYFYTGNTNVWNFGADGTLTVPGAITMPDETGLYSPGHNLYITAGNTTGCSVPGGDTIISSGLGYGGAANGGGNVTLRTGDYHDKVWNFDYNGALTIPGDIISTAGNVTAPYFVGNLDGTTVTTIGNITAPYFVGNLDGTTATLTGNVSGSYFVGNVDGTTVNTTGNITAPYFVGNVDGTTANLTGNVTGSYFVGNVSATTVEVTGNVSGSYFVGNLDGTTVTTTGNVSGSYFVGNVSATTIDATGDVTANNLFGNLTQLYNNSYTATLDNAGQLSAYYMQASSGYFTSPYGIAFTYAGDTNQQFGWTIVNADSLALTSTISSTLDTTILTFNRTTGNLSLTGNSYTTGNVTGSYFFGNGRFLTGIDATSIQNGTSNVKVYANANVTFSIDSTANVVSIGSTGTTVTGNLGVSGNVTAPYFIGNVIGNISGNISAAGANTQVMFNDNNIIAGDSGFTFDKQSQILSLIGNLVAGNITSNNSITIGSGSGGNITGANVISANTINATGNVSGVYFVGNLDGTTANLTGNVTGSYFVGNVSATTVDATGNITAPYFVGNVSATTVTTTGNITAPYFVGNLDGTTANLTGNITAPYFVGNLDGATATLTGNVSGLYFVGNVSATTIEATGNVTGSYFVGNVSATTVDATGNITAPYFVGNLDGTTVTTTGNITAPYFVGNVDATTVDTTGNVTGSYFVGNVSATTVDATGNITAPYFIGNLDGTTANLTGNVSGSYFVGNLYGTTVTTTGNVTANGLTIGNSTTIGTNVVDITGNVNITGNLTVANITYLNQEIISNTEVVAGNLTANGLHVNNSATIGNTLGVTGNVTAPYFIGNVDGTTAKLTGNVTGSYFVGNVDGTTANLTGNVTAVYFIGNLVGNVSGNLSAAGANTQVMFNDNSTIAGNAGLTFNKQSQILSLTGNIVASGITANNSITTGTTLSAAGGMQNTPIGNVTPSTALFTSVGSSGNITASAVTVNNSATIGTTLGVTGNTTVGNLITAGQIISTRTGTTGDGTGQLFLNGSTSNRIDFAAVGLGDPTTSTRSIGTKIVLWPQVDGSGVDYAIGLTSGVLWNSVHDETKSFNWFANTTSIATLTGTGSLTVSNAITASGGIQNTPIGNATASTGQFTTVSATGNITGAALTSNGSITAVTSLSALGGVQNTPIGNVTPSTALFTTVNTSGNTTVNGLTVNNSATIGTTLGVTGNITVGNVTSGNAIFNSTNSSTSNVTGAVVVSGGVGVAGNLYVGNRVGFVAANSVSVVYQIYNASTNSLDTVFG